MNLRKDKVVQSTDGDALSSKYSAVQKGYLQDEFIDLFVAGSKQAAAQQGPGSARKVVAQFQPKLPLINRGTFVRHHAIDVLVDRFLAAKNRARESRSFLWALDRTRGHSVYGAASPKTETRFCTTRLISPCPSSEKETLSCRIRP